MPWERFDYERAERERQRKYIRAQQRRLKEQASLATTQPLPIDAVEWSETFDAEYWPDFFEPLRKRLKGELAGPLGRALIAELTSAPDQAEDSIDVTTAFGTVRITWFIEDGDIIEFSVWGSPAVRALCVGLFADD